MRECEGDESESARGMSERVMDLVYTRGHSTVVIAKDTLCNISPNHLHHLCLGAEHHLENKVECAEETLLYPVCMPNNRINSIIHHSYILALDRQLHSLHR